MKILEISDQQKWNDLVISFDDYTFLQSWEWGQVNKVLGEKVWRLGIKKGEDLVGVSQVITVSARRGKILFVPHGPLLKKKALSMMGPLIKYLIRLAKENNCICLRISPWAEETNKTKDFYRSFGFRDAPSLMHAEDTCLVDLNGNEEEVLKRMRKTTRNLIRRAQRESVEVRQSQDLADVEIVDRLQLEVVKRNDFVPFTKRFSLTVMEEFFRNDKASLFLGGFQGRTTAAALIIFFGKFAYYYQSGSEETKVPVNYLLQWEVIREAKKRGITTYNMWGIAPPDKPNHPWRGLTVFKTGFGGIARKYLHTQDLPLSFCYWLLFFIEKVPKRWRKKLRVV